MLMVYWLSDWFEVEFKSFILTLEALLKDLFLWVLDQLFSLSVLMLEGTGDVFQGLDISQYISALPPEVGWVLQQTGVGQAMGIITAAIVVRIILQLIPFTRLGS